MRSRSDADATDGASVELTFEGRSIAADPGDSVASALVDAGELACRVAEAGDRRGVFCGMGICNECAVVIDGKPALACMAPVAPHIAVELHPERIPLPSTAPSLREDEHELSPEVLVVGGGPAGLAAATRLALHGVEVLLVDERSKLGGQYFKQPPPSYASDVTRLDDQYLEGRAMIEGARAAGVDMLLGVGIWGAFDPHHLVGAGPEGRYVFRPQRLVVAAGAYERGVPMPGWTLPGVMTTGAGQTLLRAHRVSPGSRVFISGNGPLNLQLAAELVRAGVRVMGVAELADVRWWAAARHVVPMAAAVPALVLRGLRYRAALTKARVPVMAKTSVIRIEGSDAAERVTVARIDGEGHPVPGTDRTFDVDAVCFGYGFVPSTDLSRALGCRHFRDPQRGQLIVERDRHGRTSVEGVWVAGDAAGIGGAQVAMVAGELAASDVLATMGRVMADGNGDLAASGRSLRRNLRFQKSLWRMYDAPLLTHQLADPDTLICRCESVSLRDLNASVELGALSAGAVKRLTRAGMGKCQGRYCGETITEMVAERSGRAVDEFAGFAPQPPTRPTTIATMAAADDE